MKCLYLSSTVVDHKSAASNHVTEIIRNLEEQGCKVYSVTATPSIFNVKFNDEKKILWFPIFKGGWRIFNAQFFFVCLFFRKEIDFIYFRLSPSKLVSKSLGLISAPKFMELNGIEITKHKDFKYLVNTANKVFVSNIIMKQSLLKMFPNLSERIAINSNVGVDTNKFPKRSKAACRTELNISQKSFVFAVVSGFQLHHDFDTLIESFELIKNSAPSAQLLLIGDGPRKNEIQSKVLNKNLHNSVNFTGGLNIELISKYLSASDVCLNLMHTDKLLTSGNVNAQKTYEYMASNKPIIETYLKENPLPEWASDRLILIRPESVNILFNTMKDVMVNYDYYITQASSNNGFIHEYYSWRNIANNILKESKTLIRDNKNE